MLDLCGWLALEEFKPVADQILKKKKGNKDKKNKNNQWKSIKMANTQ